MSVNLPVGFFGVFIGASIALFIIGFLLLKAADSFAPTIAKRFRYYRFSIVLSVLSFLLLAMIIAPVVLLPVNSGHVGVLWKRFGGGTVLGEPFDEGTVLVLPWDKLVDYSARFHVAEENIIAVTAEGLQISLEMVIRYRPVRENIPLLHKTVGEDYLNRMILPEIGSESRMVIANYSAEDVYSNNRQEIQDKIFSQVTADIRLKEKNTPQNSGDEVLSDFIHLEDLLIREVILPEKVREAIIAKVNQEHLKQEYDIRLKVAEKEANRKSIEAQGIANFQSIVTGGISETYLRWRGIEATVELAQSNNAKVVVIGGGKDGLPLILNTESLMPQLPKVLDEITKPDGAFPERN